MSKIVYVSDALLSDIVGGGELNDSELCIELKNRGFNVQKTRSSEILEKQIDTDCFYIISNFIMLKNNVKKKIQNTCRYVIYEHDHKYLKNRNPAKFKNYKAPDEMIVNKNFYKNAKKVLCQSSFHETIIKKNTGLKNLYNVSGNLWSLKSLNFIRELSKSKKQDKFSIMNSNGS